MFTSFKFSVSSKNCRTIDILLYQWICFPTFASSQRFSSWIALALGQSVWAHHASPRRSCQHDLQQFPIHQTCWDQSSNATWIRLDKTEIMSAMFHIAVVIYSWHGLTFLLWFVCVYLSRWDPQSFVCDWRCRQVLFYQYEATACSEWSPLYLYHFQ